MYSRSAVLRASGPGGRSCSAPATDGAVPALWTLTAPGVSEGPRPAEPGVGPAAAGEDSSSSPGRASSEAARSHRSSRAAPGVSTSKRRRPLSASSGPSPRARSAPSASALASWGGSSAVSADRSASPGMSVEGVASSGRGWRVREESPVPTAGSCRIGCGDEARAAVRSCSAW